MAPPLIAGSVLALAAAAFVLICPNHQHRAALVLTSFRTATPVQERQG